MRQPRPPFSSAWDFIALRPLDTEVGRIDRGQIFPKETVPARRLQLMYDALHIDPIVPGYADPRPGFDGQEVPADFYSRPLEERHAIAPQPAVPQPAPAPAAPPTGKTPKNLGKGKWSVVAGDEVIHPGPLTKEEAEALAAEE